MTRPSSGPEDGQDKSATIETGNATPAPGPGQRRTTEQIAAERRAFWSGLRNDLPFWRGLGMVSTAAALVMACLLLTRQLEPAAPAPSSAYVALLADDRAQPVVMVVGDGSKRHLSMRVVRPQTVGADRSLELWAVPREGKPRSLGLLASDGGSALDLPSDLAPTAIDQLLVSLEAKGGATGANGPAGPVVLKGAWLPLQDSAR